ncbi:MAG: hypothetical protein LKI88_00750 [Bifidobacterium sp.]|jgi:hypothetical protein|nr:hypothetical protein [Bifidobacterium sp.]MCI1864459.1 hypothetical protein [Bifidobacterium sp.]
MSEPWIPHVTPDASMAPVSSRTLGEAWAAYRGIGITSAEAEVLGYLHEERRRLAEKAFLDGAMAARREPDVIPMMIDNPYGRKEK